MPIPKTEQAKMLAVPLCGRQVVTRLEAAGVTRLADLRGADPEDLLHRVNLAAGHPIWRHPRAVQSLANLVRAADAQVNASEGRWQTADGRRFAFDSERRT